MDTEENSRGKLYICPTPIGNLGDITERTLNTLRSADIIAAEDTRNTLRLLNHFAIKSHLTSYHEYNRYDKAAELIKQLLEGKNVACVTDAGTPGISDPGEVLVAECIASGIEVVSLPGATAFVTALTVSGLPTGRFVFEGFLPKDKKEKQRILDDLREETRTIILYEAPHRLKETLATLEGALGADRRIALCRELTKIHEEILRFTIKEAVAHYADKDPKGEYVLVIEGRSADELIREKRRVYDEISVREHFERYISTGMDKKEAMKAVAEDRGVTKRDIYRELL
ncbi:MAG: 16S rRNA (cytidine(1402)-2'-O)-methyltransferase [Lachnospiraceae bacterium]|nr:16S rRNA (cytidine(1402)-2'-O)-methyltransferase [Lachnospiraceae bacterium]